MRAGAAMPQRHYACPAMYDVKMAFIYFFWNGKTQLPPALGLSRTRRGPARAAHTRSQDAGLGFAAKKMK